MKDVASRWLRGAVFGTILMALGSILMGGVHVQTRGRMRDVLLESKGRIKSDEQMQALYEIMTRGSMLSIGGFSLVLLGVVLSILGLAGFLILRRKARREDVGGK